MPMIRAETVKARLTSIDAWILPKTKTTFAPEESWSNHDMEPVPRSQWTWTKTTFAAYWASDLVSVTSWTQVSSFVALGMSWWESVLAIFVAGFLVSIVISLNGIIGARLHTPFSVTVRSVYGINLGKLVIGSRCVIALFWESVVTFQGGVLVTELLVALSPSYRDMPNHLPANSGLTSQSFLSFVLFAMFQFPFIYIKPTRLRWLFVTKMSTVPLVALGTMAWCIAQAGSRGASAALSAPASGTWFMFMSAVTSSAGTWITLACNIGDFSRYSKKETSAAVQVAAVPILWAFCSMFGAISAICCKVAFDETLWQPSDIIAKWQHSSGGRAAAFFCSAAWILCSIGTNVTANSVSAANDLCCLFPKWIDIFRGQLLAVTVGVFAFAPWKVLASASSFVSFMASYSVVLAPVAGILCADFYIIKHQKINVPEMYNTRSDGMYRFSKGWNWRAGIALIVAIGPNVPGMAKALTSSVEIGGAKYVFAFGDIFGVLVGAGVHVILSLMWPDLKSQAAEAVYAQDILDAQVEGVDSEVASQEDKEKDVGTGNVELV